MGTNSNIIPQEVLDRYVNGTASLAEITAVSAAMSKDENLRKLITILEDLHKNGVLSEDTGEIPMASMAAMSEGNLCDVLCEQYILRDYLGEQQADDDCLAEALDNCWLKESGTPLHNMGRLLERHGLSVARCYDNTLEDLKCSLQEHKKVIAVLDYGQLWNKESDGIFHAVVCLNIVDDVIRIFDPAVDGCANYTIEEFAKAWNYSKNYLVIASAQSMDYIPHPIDVSDVELDDQLLELTEAIAENAHEIWAYNRKNEGWTYGPQRDDHLLQHPDLVPYSELPEGEKYYDRAMALNTIRLVKKLGFNINRKNTAYCPHCGEFVADTAKFCPECGQKLE